MPSLALVIAVAVLLGARALPSAAAPSDLDPGFGTGGRVATPLAASGDIGVDAGGRTVAAGVVVDDHVTVLRYERNGLPDATFGAGGITHVRVAWGPRDVLALVVQPDGRIVAVVEAADFFVVMRLTTEGTIDPTFQSLFHTTYNYPSRVSARFVGLLTHADGLELVKLVYSTRAQMQYFSRITYDRDGLVLADDSDEAPSISQVDVALDARGRLLVASTAFTPDETPRLVEIARYSGSGALDPTFGTAGRATTGLLTPPYRRVPVAATATGVTTAVTTDDGFLRVARLDASGAPDPSFGIGGTAAIDLGMPTILDRLTVTPDDRILVPASSPSDAAPAWRLVALDTDGTPDSTFGTGGVLARTGETLGFLAHPIVVKPDGRLVVASFDGDSLVLTQLVGFPRACADADGDGGMTVTDGVQVLRAAAGLPSTCRLDVCDVDGSGEISSTDGVRTLRAAAGLSADLRCEP
jgi:uncharacterized delta-60 repeat protein